MLTDRNGAPRGAVFPAWVEPKIAVVISAIASTTGLGWLLMLGADPLGIASICRNGFSAIGWNGVLGLIPQWQIMLMTMLLPCIAPAIVTIARAERQRYGTLTAAMAFTLGYGAVMLIPAILGAILQAMDLQSDAIRAALLALATIIALDRLRRPRQQIACATATDPLRIGLRHGLAGLPMATQMVCLQLVFGLDNLAAMIALAGAMIAFSHIRRIPRMASAH